MVQEYAPEILFTIKTTQTEPFPRGRILESNTLKWVAIGGIGIDHLRPWDPRKIAVTNAAGAYSWAMAQYCMAGVYVFACGFPRYQAQQRARSWIPSVVERVAGATLLIIGMGRTGTALATLARKNAMRVVGVRSRPGNVPGFGEIAGPDALPRLIPEADYVCVTLPLTPATRGLVGPVLFASMKRTAVIINVARGGIVDEDALVRALKTQRIRGAVLDVFTTEPLPPEHALWGFDNVLITPHSSSMFDGWDREVASMFCDNLGRWVIGAPLENLVPVERGY